MKSYLRPLNPRVPVPAAVLAAVLAGALVVGPVSPGIADDEAPRRPLPFSTDRLPPAPLPVPLDRHVAGEIVSFDGERVGIRWGWESAAELEDFDAFVPIRSGLSGGFTWVEPGRVDGRGTGGLRLRLGMLDDLNVRVGAKLVVPHDLGVVLAKPDSSDESILCHIQDIFFTRFDDSAGNANMINKIGGIPATAPGDVEFRYVDRKPQPELARGDVVALDVARKSGSTSFVIEPEKRTAVTLAGKDTDTPMTRFQPGIYVAGGAAEFGPLRIEGALDPEWCQYHDVLPHVASDLLHPGNRFRGAEKRAAQRVESFLVQDADTPEKKRVEPAAIGRIVGETDLPMVIRIRAAEALMERGVEDGTVVEGIASLLDSGDRPARLLAWQVLRPRLPWHFEYDPDGDARSRKDGALLVGHYLRERDEALATGKVFVDGYWYTPRRADDIRGEWERAWDLRSPRVRLRTNLTREWADWYMAAMEAAYAEMVRVVGQEPPPDALPLSVLAFRKKDDYEAFCKAHGYASKSGWGRFVDLEKNVAFVTFSKREAPYWALSQMSKLFLQKATDRYWPAWFAEGRASWFGNPSYQTSKWDGKTLTLGRIGQTTDHRILKTAAQEEKLWKVAEFLSLDPRDLDGDQRRLWYVHAWALHHWLMREAPDDVRGRFARWQQTMESQELSPREVEAVGRRRFLGLFAGKVAELDRQFREWVLRM